MVIHVENSTLQNPCLMQRCYKLKGTIHMQGVLPCILMLLAVYGCGYNFTLAITIWGFLQEKIISL